MWVSHISVACSSENGRWRHSPQRHRAAEIPVTGRVTTGSTPNCCLCRLRSPVRFPVTRQHPGKPASLKGVICVESPAT